MEYKKIKLYEYDFHLKIDVRERTVTASKFQVRGKLPAQMTDEDVRRGHELQNSIFNGDWNWLVFANDFIRLSDFNIEIMLSDIEYDGAVRWGGARLIGGQKETCTHCDDPQCDWDCMEALEWASDRDPDMCRENTEELEDKRNFNYAMDALESLILAHAQAGVDVTSNIYLEGYKTAVDAICNNMR